MRPDVVGGEIGAGEGLDDELADPLAVGPAAGPWREPAHDLAHVARGRGAGRGDRLADERGDLVLGQGLRQVLAEDRDLGLLLGGEVLAAAGAERLDRLAAGLDLAAQDGQELVVGEGMALRFSTL